MSLYDDVASSLGDDSEEGATFIVTRRAFGTYGTSGIWTKGAVASTFPITASVQPATGMQRVVGGRDMRSAEQGQNVDDVRVVYTGTELRVRVEGANDPDEVAYQGGTWTVVRVETWSISGDAGYRALITRETRGGS